jgi:hypothetical protein
LFDVGFFRHTTGLHTDLVGAPFRRAVFRGLGEGWRYRDAASKRSGDKQTMMDLHFHSPDAVLANPRESIHAVGK